MADIITAGASTITPTIVLGIEGAREGQTKVHPILGRPNPDVTLRPTMLRSGVLTMGFAGATSEADSKAAADIHATAAVFTLTSTDRTSLQMSYVVAGQITRALDPETRNAWTVAVAYQEVTA